MKKANYKYHHGNLYDYLHNSDYGKRNGYIC